MEPARGRPPSAGKQHLFSSSGKVITKEQKRSSSKTSILRRLSMSATNVLNGNGAAPTSTPAQAQAPEQTPARTGNAGRSGATTQQTTISALEPSPPSASGLMSFKKHFRRSKKQHLFDPNDDAQTGSNDRSGSSGGGTVDAPMLSGGTETTPVTRTVARAANDVGSDGSDSVLDPYDSTEYQSGSESEIEDSRSAEDLTGSLDPTTLAGSPITTVGAVSTRTSSFPQTDEQKPAPNGAQQGHIENKPPNHEQVSKPHQPPAPTPTTFVVPGPPPPVPQKVPEQTNVVSPPTVPPKIPAPPPPAGAPPKNAGVVGHVKNASSVQNTQTSQSMQSLQAVQRTDQERKQQQQRQQNIPGRAPAPTKTAKEPKEKSGGLLGGLKKLRRSDSKRGSLDPSRLQPPPTNSKQAAEETTSAASKPAPSQVTAQIQQPQQPQQPQPKQAAVLPPPPPPIQSPPSGNRAVDIEGIPSSLRPGGGQPVQQNHQQQSQQQYHHEQQNQQSQQQQQQQPHIPGNEHARQMAYAMQQQAVLQHAYNQQQQQPAWPQSEIDMSMYALSSQLAAAHQQSAGQVALLHERDAEIAELNALVGRLRTRIQEQVKQLEQLPAGLPGLNTMSGLNNYAAGGVGQLPDGQIRSRWKGLRWQIRQCVEARLSALPSSSAASTPVSPERAPFLRRLTPDYDKFLHSRKGSVYLVEAAIWTVLADSVFGGARHSSRMCWAARWSTPLAKMNDNMMFSRATDPAYHHWRVQTAVFVRSLDAPADGDQNQQQNQQQSIIAAPYIEAVVRQLEAEVGILLALGTGGPSGVEDASSAGPTGHRDTPSPSSPPPSSSSSSSVLRRQLSDVVAEAIGLDADLCQQRAWFYVHFPSSTSGHRYGMPFDAREMESVTVTSETASISSGGVSGGSETHLGISKMGINGSSSNVNNTGMNGGHTSDDVSLVVRPALFKAGNSRGEAYDQTATIEPSIVCQTTPGGRGFRRWAGGRRDRSRSRG